MFDDNEFLPLLLRRNSLKGCADGVIQRIARRIICFDFYGAQPGGTIRPLDFIGILVEPSINQQLICLI